MVITLLHEVINMVTEDPKNAVSQCLSYVSTPSSSPQTIRKSRPTLDSETAKVHLSLLSLIRSNILQKKSVHFLLCKKHKNLINTNNSKLFYK